MEKIRARSYGTAGPLVIVLHGGPGAPGYMAPVARGLADSFRIVEPFQRGSGGEPLSVARHMTGQVKNRTCSSIVMECFANSSSVLAFWVRATNYSGKGPAERVQPCLCLQHL